MLKAMQWLFLLVQDFFAAFGFMVFVFLAAAVIFDGKVDADFSVGWFLFPPLIYAWLMSELYHWPREKAEHEKGDD